MCAYKKMKGKRDENKHKKREVNNIKYSQSRGLPQNFFLPVLFSFFFFFMKSVLLCNVIHPVKYYFDARYFLRRHSLNPKIIRQTRNSFAECFLRSEGLGPFIIHNIIHYTQNTSLFNFK